ncbi:MAG: DUF4215 domain-containing protein [Kofleriaceae bacterium]
MRRSIVGVLIALAGCIEPSLEVCDDGAVCGGEQVCAPGGGCADPISLAACVERVDGDACEASFGPGQCRQGVCAVARCGDGIVDRDEVCDDGNAVDGDGCARDCRSDETCGNGVRDAGEACDDGNAADGDACQRDCTLPRCGDGVIDPGETCDDGNAVDGDGCAASCASTEACGNGVVDYVAGETCDDGNLVSGDGCQATCRFPACGDGVLDAGEVCDDGNLVSGDGCAGSCASTEVCGNGVVDFVVGEQCDDGNLVDHDGCQHTCVVQRCGDGIVDADAGEVCDDGNLSSGDGCAGDCASDEQCGNEILDAAAGEQCDAGPGVSHDGCTSACAVELPNWTRWTPRLPPTMLDATGAYDARRQRVIVTGGYGGGVYYGDTWQLAANGWIPLPVAGALPARRHGAIAYDATREHLIAFGGTNGPTSSSYLADTWTLDDAGWRLLTPATSPPARASHAMAFDVARGVLVLFGGNVAGGVTQASDTWEFDGATWTQRTFAVTPPARRDHVMAYDPVGLRVVMFGGSGNSFSFLGDTWTYDGLAWTQVVGPGPGARSDAAMAFDPDRGTVVVHGGYAGGAALTTMYELSGSTWSARATTGGAPAASAHVLVFDAARHVLVMMSGTGAWELDAASVWRQRATTASPVASPGASAAYASRQGRALLVRPGTGVAETWSFDGTGWEQLAPATSPPSRYDHRVVYDSARDRLVLFGGTGAGGPLADTWVFAVGTWTQLSPTTSPQGRTRHAMAYDEARDVVVLYGGISSSGQADDNTYEFDGTTWTRIGVSSPPGYRIDTQLVYDAARARVVLWGGSGSDTITVWEYDGAWVARDGTGPSARQRLGFTYDPVRRVSVLFSGDSGAKPDDTWELGDAGWVRLAPATIPPQRSGHVMVYDGRRARVVVHGGTPLSGGADETWELQYRNGGAPEEACTDAVADADGDGLAGCADPDCWGRCTPTCPPATSCPVDAPRCGDGSCGAPLEDDRICPEDCAG